MKQEKIEAYRSEMVYLLVKTKYSRVTSPAEYAQQIMKIQTKPKPAKRIIGDILQKLG